MRNAWWVVLLVALGAAPALAQAPQPDAGPAIEAMKALSFFLGHWSGEGWAQMGPGPREEFTLTETVEAKLGGALLLVEGRGFDKSAEHKQIHDALGVIVFDPATGKYRFSAFLAGRSPLDVEPEVGANTFRWSFEPQPGIHIRYTSTFEGGTWTEVGEMSADGVTWRQFFETKMQRQ